MLTDQEFRVKSDDALDEARKALLPLADEHGFEVDLQNGVLNILFDEPAEARFVISPNAPVRQIWVSALGRSFKLAWAPDQHRFMLEKETLAELLQRLSVQHLQS